MSDIDLVTAGTPRRPPPARARRARGSGPVKADDQPLYAPRRRVYPRRVRGRFRTLKWWVLGVVLSLYYVVPWLRWDRGEGNPDQAILLDMAGRRAYFLDLEIWPQEIYYLTGVLVAGAVGLFMATALAGRVWCGFACPQTLWTDLFMLVERWIEGDRNARMRRDGGPVTAEKVLRKALKHGAWLFIALATGGMWICYYNDAPTVTAAFFTGQASHAVYGFTFLFTATTYVLAGWAREQVCIYMCPWPRFQAAMFDEDSFVVTYEEWRGEPRGKARRGDDFQGRGHCVDCTMCVQVCPTGVDIRNGQQMACIGCGLCIDACNDIMARFGLPGELITYDSIANQLSRARGATERVRLWRPRTIAYAAILTVVVTAMAVGLATRSRLEVNVLGDRAPLFVTLADGDIRNGYTYKVLNMLREPKTYTLGVEGIEGATLAAVGRAGESAAGVRLAVKADAVGTFRVYVRAPRAALAGRSTDLTFVLTDTATGETTRHETVFAGPGP